MTQLPDIRELQVFLALVNGGSFSTAAKALGITQPSVSMQIAKLEQNLGFPLFFRCPEGTVLTKHGRKLVPIAEELIREHTKLLRRASYWKRARSKHVKIWTDGSILSSRILTEAGGSSQETWSTLDAGTDWLDALQQYEVDIVIAGSFLNRAEIPGMANVTLQMQAGMTIAWNRAFYPWNPRHLHFPQVLSHSVILPCRSMALGFREFLHEWCQNTYGLSSLDIIESSTEREAIDICRLGLGVMIMPGDAASRMNLAEAGLESQQCFEFPLPQAFRYGIRYRKEEQSPTILAMVKRLRKHTAWKF